MEQVKPILLSAIICENVIFDRLTSMPSIINILQNINAPEYPVRHNRMVFFCELTNGHGLTDMKIKLVDSQQGDKVLFQQVGKIEFKDVKQIASLALNIQGLVLPHPGEFHFQLFAADTLIGERRIVCRKVKLPPKNQKPD